MNEFVLLKVGFDTLVRLRDEPRSMVIRKILTPIELVDWGLYLRSERCNLHCAVLF